MSSVTRAAGTAGTYRFTLDRVPDSPPQRTIYSDPERTVIVAATATTTATDSPVSFTGTIPPLTAGRYYLRHTFTVNGGVFVDNDDEILLEVPGGTVTDSLVTVDRYRALTGDQTTPDSTVADRLVLAQQLVEDYLRRPLPVAQRTERLRLYPHLDGGWAAYPRATPLQSVDGGLRIDGAAVLGGHPDDLTHGWGQPVDRPRLTVTYVGGYTALTLPVTIAQELAAAARVLIAQVTTAPAAGAVNAEGDVDLGTPPVVPTLTLDEPPGLSTAARTRLRPYKRRSY